MGLQIVDMSIIVRCGLGISGDYTDGQIACIMDLTQLDSLDLRSGKDFVLVDTDGIIGDSDFLRFAKIDGVPVCWLDESPAYGIPVPMKIVYPDGTVKVTRLKRLG